ncbi:Uncharacterised protein [Mycobacterium tuberculosis]|uniref:Uncharacterized protein n=1 Tax=Mycobacterium tuberculosis TaxID=1773 RepID=A0A654TTM4_MYCTX|nr:Uncharacterised protein [Mycobacterium tuberculosis]
MGNLANVIDVVTPKLPPPPPRSAQNSSAWSSADALTASPPGNTTVADLSASQVNPAWRESAPNPPPRVKPATPTVGQLPVGIARLSPANA